MHPRVYLGSSWGLDGSADHTEGLGEDFYMYVREGVGLWIGEMGVSGVDTLKLVSKYGGKKRFMLGDIHREI